MDTLPLNFGDAPVAQTLSNLRFYGDSSAFNYVDELGTI